MKNTNILLIGIGTIAYLNRNRLKDALENAVDKASDQFNVKLQIKPLGFPSVKVNWNNIVLNGKVEISNQFNFSATLNTYQLRLILKKPNGDEIQIGNTPVANINKEITKYSGTDISYMFSVPLATISTLLTTERSTLKSWKLNLLVDQLKVNQIPVPASTIDITDTWINIINSTESPSSLINSIITRL